MPRFLLALLATLSAQVALAGPTFRVAIDPALAPATGRLLVGIGPKGRTPSYTSTDPGTLPILAIDANALAADKPVTVDGTAMTFPMDALKTLPRGEYSVQAVLVRNRDLSVPTAPGNLVSELASVTLDPAADTVVPLTLTKTFAELEVKDTATHKYLALPSKLLSDFHKRPMVYRLAVVLPADFEKDATKRYPLVVHIGGFGTRFTSARRMLPNDRFVQILLDGAGPFGDPYQVNSANNGPYGDALTQEVIPHVEKAYRCVGTPKARFTTGGSTGGWVSLALQLYYPDFFNGCWSLFADSVDFRAFELINIYTDANAYVNRFGFERPSKRTLDGDTVFTVRFESHLERVLGRGGRWELGGLDWASWNAVYGPKGDDGLPKPLWDGATGKLDRSVTEHWERYDLRKVLETRWPQIGPKLGGKIHIWMGDADDYFLNNGMHRFRAATKALTNPAFDGVLQIEMRQPHGGGWGRGQIFNEMAARAAAP